MNNEEIIHTRELIQRYRENFFRLELRLPSYGIDVPIGLINEIEYIKGEIDKLEQKLNELSNEKSIYKTIKEDIDNLRKREPDLLDAIEKIIKENDEIIANRKRFNIVFNRICIVAALIFLLTIPIISYDYGNNSGQQQVLTARAIQNSTAVTALTQSPNPTPTERVIIVTAIPEPTIPMQNGLIINNDFEYNDNGWSNIKTKQFGGKNETLSTFPDRNFPGSITMDIVKDNVLTGQHSLHISNSLDISGTFQGYLVRKGILRAYGAIAYVFVPKLTNVRINYIQICIPLPEEWVCSEGAKIIEGQWTPLILDMRKTSKAGNIPATMELDQIAIQWNYTTTANAQFEIYVDSVQFFQSSS